MCLGMAARVQRFPCQDVVLKLYNRVLDITEQQESRGCHPRYRALAQSVH